MGYNWSYDMNNACLYMFRYILKWVELSLNSAAASKTASQDVIKLPKEFLKDTVALFRSSQVCPLRLVNISVVH